MVGWTRAVVEVGRHKWTDLRSASDIVLLGLVNGLDKREERKTRLDSKYLLGILV